MAHDRGVNRWPHAHVYVVPCGQGLLTSTSQPQSRLLQVNVVPAVMLSGTRRFVPRCPPAQTLPHAGDEQFSPSQRAATKDSQAQ
jgi:hypothetical protein